MVWNPQQYLKFSGHRLRPAVDLLMRIPDFPVRSVADLGAGAGEGDGYSCAKAELERATNTKSRNAVLGKENLNIALNLLSALLAEQ